MKYNIIHLLFFIQLVTAKSFLLSNYHNSMTTFMVAKNVIINDCSGDAFPLHIKEIKITPDIIQAGEELTLEAKGYLDEPILDGASADVMVKLGAVRLLHKKYDVCKELEEKKDDVEIQCPIYEGYRTVIQKVTLPKEVPKARFIVDVHAFFDKEEKRPLACLRVIADFRVKRRFDSQTLMNSFFSF